MIRNLFRYLGGWFWKVKFYRGMKSVAIEFPYVIRSMQGLSRSSLKNDFSECTGCLKCKETCPVHAISISGYEFSSLVRRPTTSQGIPFQREVQSFTVDYSKCVFCGLCVEVCPTGSLTNSKSMVKPEKWENRLIVDLMLMPRARQ